MRLVFAFLSAIFAALTSVFAKIGIKDVESDLATALRTVVVLAMAWLMVLVVGSYDTIGDISDRTLAFLILSGMATGASWLCFYRALQEGPASMVAPIDKLSILFTVIFAAIVLKERMSRRSRAGLTLLVAGTMAMLLWRDPTDPEPGGVTAYNPDYMFVPLRTDVFRTASGRNPPSGTYRRAGTQEDGRRRRIPPRNFHETAIMEGAGGCQRLDLLPHRSAPRDSAREADAPSAWTSARMCTVPHRDAEESGIAISRRRLSILTL